MKAALVRRPRKLGLRALNRALLARQGLLARTKKQPLAMVEHLVGMQAQNPLDPYVGLWTRLAPFDPSTLARALEGRRAVRLALMRSTIHLVSGRDCSWLRAIVQPAIDRGLYVGSPYGKRLGDVDRDALAKAARALLADGPLTTSVLGRRLQESFSRVDGEALGNAARAFVPLVQVPPRGVWGKGGQPLCTPADTWLTGDAARRVRVGAADVDALVLRYLAAFGPASARDAQTWAGVVPALAEAFTRLRKRLLAFEDDEGRPLFDLPRAPRPREGTPAPPRFLPEYDNVLLAHADRERVASVDERKRMSVVAGPHLSPFLVDGFVAGTWRVQREARKAGGRATLLVTPSAPLDRRARAAVAAEAERLLAFLAADVTDRIVEVA